MSHNIYVPGTGSTNELSLRVSVAALIRVLFKNPVEGDVMLALERTATLIKEKGTDKVIVKAKPFGGGVRLLQPHELKLLIGDFHYDSERSRQQNDFRIQIHPSQWANVKEACVSHKLEADEGVIDSSPVRELSEEFMDALRIQITPDDYKLTPGEILIEERLTVTENVNAQGSPTRRIYYLFDAMVVNTHIVEMIMENSRTYSDADLEKMAFEDAMHGGRGRANAILAISLDQLIAFYRSIPGESSNDSVSYRGHRLDGNVRAILDL